MRRSGLHDRLAVAATSYRTSRAKHVPRPIAPFFMCCVFLLAQSSTEKEEETKTKIGGRVRLCAPAAVGVRIKTRQSFAIS